MRCAIFTLVFLLAGLARCCRGQSISPLYMECSVHHCAGRFNVGNNGVVPLVATIDPHGLEYRRGQHMPVITPLRPWEHVQTSASSVRIPPKQTREVDYQVNCDTVPCAVAMSASMTAQIHVNGGIQARVILFSEMFVCEKAKNCRANTKRAAGL